MLAYKTGRLLTGWLSIAIFIVYTVIPSTQAAKKHSSKRSGYIGCLFSGSLCSTSEECFDDHLFGTCQRRDVLPDDYQYRLSSDQIRHLSSSLQRLVSSGYTWRDPFTQCMLAQMLFTYRHGSARNHGKPVCTAVDDVGKIDDTAEGLDSSADPGFSGSHHSTVVNDDAMGGDINVSRLVSDVNMVQSFQLDRKSYKEFMKFMSSLSADDLYALKQFLLEESIGIGNDAARKFNGPVLPPREKSIAVNDDKTGIKVIQSEFTVDDLSTQLKTTFAAYQSTPSVIVSTDDRADTEGGVKVSFQSKVGTQRRVQVLIYVLFGLVAIFVVVCLITCFQFCRSFNVTRRWWKGSVDDELATEEYQDLCRQHMTAAMTEKPRGWRDPVVESRDQSLSSSPVSGTLPLKEEPVKSGVDISTGTLVLSYMEKYLNDTNRIQREWDELSALAAEVDLGSFAPAAFDASNARKNRCADILPYEKSRVLLKAEDNATGATYINASYIKDDDPRRALYVVTQGPLPNTVTDFWQMVWEQGCVAIINLTCVVDGSVALCHRYWPETGRDLFHIYEVSLLSEHDCCDNYVVRNFALRNIHTNEVRDITQFHFLSWPSDLPSVPESAPALLEFRRRVNKSFRGRSPIVVHCSDGVGRTGTYCLIDVVLNRIAKGVKQIDIAATLEHLRDQRFNLVHTKEQYEFALTAVAYEVHQMLFPPAH